MFRERVISELIIFFLVPVCFLTSRFFNDGRKQTPQNDPVYICFEKDAGLIEIEQLAGSSITTFKVPRKGYETMEQRRKAFTLLEKEEKLVPFNALYFFEFYATMYPEKENLTYLQEVHCRTPEELREGKIDMENDPQLVFIQVVSDKHVLVWKDVKRRNRI